MFRLLWASLCYFARRRTYRARAEQAEADLAAERARSAALERQLAACQQQLSVYRGEVAGYRGEAAYYRREAAHYREQHAACCQQLRDRALTVAVLQARPEYMEQLRGSSAGSTEDVEVPAAPGGPQPQQAASAAAGAAQQGRLPLSVLAGRSLLAPCRVSQDRIAGQRCAPLCRANPLNSTRRHPAWWTG